jgi:MFS family permease
MSLADAFQAGQIRRVESQPDAAPALERGHVLTDIPARLDGLPWSGWHVRVVTALAVTWLLDGLEGSLGGSLAGALKNPSGLGFSDAQLGLSSSFYLGGAVLGALTFGYLADRYGRRRLFTVTLLLYLCATAATGLSWNLWSFTVFRMLTGAGIGGEYAAINSAVDEIVPARLRGRVDLFINGTFWMGIIFGSLISSAFLSPSLFGEVRGWRFAFLSGLPIGIAVLYMRRFIPESPRWLLGHGKVAEAETVTLAIEIAALGTTSFTQATRKYVRVSTGQAPILLRMVALLTGQYRSRALLCFGLMTAQAFFYNSVFFSLGLVLLRYYGVAASRVGLCFLPIAAGNFLGPVLLGPLFDSLGRKRMIAATYCLSGVFLLASSYLFRQNLLSLNAQIAWWCATFFFASTAASSAYLTVSEIFPQEVRASSIAFFYAFGTLAGGVFGPLVFGRILGSNSRSALFLGYAAGAAVMVAAGISQKIWGVAAERRSLESLVPVEA